MTSAEREELITWAKRNAVPVHACVTAGICPDHLLGKASRNRLAALVIVLAECASPQRLKAVTEAPGDLGMPALSREDALRQAHAEYARLCRAGEPVPYRLRLLEREYRLSNKRRREEAAEGDAA